MHNPNNENFPGWAKSTFLFIVLAGLFSIIVFNVHSLHLFYPWVNMLQPILEVILKGHFDLLLEDGINVNTVFLSLE